MKSFRASYLMRAKDALLKPPTSQWCSHLCFQSSSCRMMVRFRVGFSSLWMQCQALMHLRGRERGWPSHRIKILGSGARPRSSLESFLILHTLFLKLKRRTLRVSLKQHQRGREPIIRPIIAREVPYPQGQSAAPVLTLVIASRTAEICRAAHKTIRLVVRVYSFLSSLFRS